MNESKRRLERWNGVCVLAMVDGPVFAPPVSNGLVAQLWPVAR